MKKYAITFWITTAFIFLFEGLVPALTSNSELAREGTRHLGYPDYFRTTLTVFKVLGALTLIIPKLPPRVKEWAYAGFAIDFICASISNTAVDGFGSGTIFPLVALAILIASYVSYHKLQGSKK